MWKFCLRCLLGGCLNSRHSSANSAPWLHECLLLPPCNFSIHTLWANLLLMHDLHTLFKLIFQCFSCSAVGTMGLVAGSHSCTASVTRSCQHPSGPLLYLLTTFRTA